MPPRTDTSVAEGPSAAAISAADDIDFLLRHHWAAPGLRSIHTVATIIDAKMGRASADAELIEAAKVMLAVLYAVQGGKHDMADRLNLPEFERLIARHAKATY